MTTRNSSSAASVAEYIHGVPEPLRSEVEGLRQVILGVADGIAEEVKWNAPSFYLGEHFATMRLHGKVPLQLILHLGAKKGASVPRESIADPAGLLKWLGPDRACVEFAEPDAVASRATALKSILSQWLRHVPLREAG